MGQYLTNDAAFPTTFLIDQKGIIQHIASGLSSVSELDEKISQLLGK